MFCLLVRQSLLRRAVSRHIHTFSSWSYSLTTQTNLLRSKGGGSNSSARTIVVMDSNSSAAVSSSAETNTNEPNAEGHQSRTDPKQQEDSSNNKRKRQSKWKSWSKNKKKKEPWYRNRGEKQSRAEEITDGVTKNERSKNNRRQDDWESKAPKTIPHEGSFAHKNMQKLFDVNVDVLPKNGTNCEGETVEDDTGKNAVEVKVPKRKLGMLVSFLGSNYGGFQINAGQRTLQAELELALYRAGIIASSNFGWPSKYSWSNSARTDKGVHAAAQVVSLKGEMVCHTENDEMTVEKQLNEMREKVNEHLPDDIRILDFERVTRPFCARTNRDKVRYQVSTYKI